MNKNYIKLGVYLVSLDLLLSNWNEYVNSFLLMLNCGVVEDCKLSLFIYYSWNASYFFNNFEPLVVGLNFMIAVVIMIKYNEYEDQQIMTSPVEESSRESLNENLSRKKLTGVMSSADTLASIKTIISNDILVQRDTPFRLSDSSL